MAATCWVAPQLAAAEDEVEAQLRQMSERMAQMEQQLQATQEELAASKQRVDQQQAVIQDLDSDREASSALSRFLSETEFSGLLAASYTYNFKNFSSSAVNINGNSTTLGENSSVFGIVAPHHSNSNNFQVDQLAFRMKKTPTSESRAGWGASLTWGASADSLAGRSLSGGSCSSSEGSVFCDSDSDANGDLPELTEAYAAYLFDIGEGVKLVGGRYMTPVGAESFFANENFNVTRGLLWTLQPVNHTGAYAGGTMGEAITWQLGAANGYSGTMSDTDTQPTFVGSVGYRADTLGLKVNGVYGGNIDDILGWASSSPYALVFETGQGRNSDKIGLLDAVLTFDPSDRLSTWVNFDYYWTSGTGNNGTVPASGDFKDLSIWGIAGAGRYALTESTGFALRYEYLSFGDIGQGVSQTDADLMSLTATLDHHLTDNLVLSAEGRWDRGRIDDIPNRIYFQDNDSIPVSGPNTADANNHQVLGLVQLRYDF
jgi:hypothetical protein